MSTVTDTPTRAFMVVPLDRVLESGLTEDAAVEQWQAIRDDQAIHRAICLICRPDIAVCATGQRLAETERAGYGLVRRAREDRV